MRALAAKTRMAPRRISRASVRPSRPRRRCPETPASRIGASSPRCPASTPFATARRSVVGARSRFSNNFPGPSPGQSATTRPPATAPPSTNATVAVPWSVPLVPFTRAVRPNSVIASTAVRRHSGPSAAFSAASPASSVAQHVVQPRHLGDMRVPAVDLQRRDTRPVRARAAASRPPRPARESVLRPARRRPPPPGQRRIGEPRSRRPSAIAGPITGSATASAAIAVVEVGRGLAEPVPAPSFRPARPRAAAAARRPPTAIASPATGAGAGAPERRHHAVQPAAGQALVGAAFQVSPAPRNGCAPGRVRRPHAPAAARPPR